jgi:hypothetical protein
MEKMAREILAEALQAISKECEEVPAFNSVWAASIQALADEALASLVGEQR